MAIFSPSTTTQVASVAYNLNGSGPDNPVNNFLKTNTVTGLFAGVDSLSEHIVQTQLSGPSFNDKRFMRWAQKNYAIGDIGGKIEAALRITPEDYPLLRDHLEAIGEPTPIVVQEAFSTSTDTNYFVHRYILETFGEFTDGTEYGGNWNDDARVMDIFITSPPDENGNRTSSVSTVSMPDFKLGVEYLYLYYNANGQDLLYIYEIGSGEFVLDFLVRKATHYTPPGAFYPIIPLRRYNLPIDNAETADDFPTYKKAFNRLTGEKIEDMLENIAKNEDIDEIDHCFLVMGAELNSPERSSKEYIYHFLRNLMDNQVMDADDMSLLDSIKTFKPAESRIVLQSNFEETRVPYKVAMSWMHIREFSAPGLGKTGAKRGDIWWKNNGDFTGRLYQGHPDYQSQNHVNNFFYSNVVRLYWQDADATHRYLEIYGLRHTNYVAGQYSVRITAQQALDDIDLTGFVVPMHTEIVKKLSIIEANQFALSNKMLIFNVKEINKKKWYETSLFRVILAVTLIVVTVTVFPGSGAAASGFLGSHVAVGTALGLTGISALIAGATLNVIAGMIVSQILSQATTGLLGDELGALVAQLATMYMASEINGNGFDWGAMSRADQLMAMTNAVSAGVQGYALGQINDMMEEVEQLSDDYDAQMEKILELHEDLGYTGININPLIFTDLGNSSFERESRESSATFLKRTLLTGTDIVKLSHAMIEDFPRVSLSLPDAQN